MRTIGFVVSPGTSIMSLGVAAVFELTNLTTARESYKLRFISETGGSIRTSTGLSVETEPFDKPHYDTLLVSGSSAVTAATPGMIKFVRRAAKRCRRVASICTGAFVLAEAGLLDGRRVTTHWLYARDLQKRFPEAKVDDDRIFINDGPIWTSAGLTAGVDLALALVEADLGAEAARMTARKLVVYHRRAGGQSQFSVLLELEPKSDRVQRALDYAKRNLHAELSVESLAEVAHLSARQFSRAFRAETGQSPAKAVEMLRVEAARLMMEQSQHPVDFVAEQTGFADRNRMRRAFLRALGQPPQVVRRNARA